MFLLLILASEEKGIFQKEDKTLKKYFLENNLQGLILISNKVRNKSRPIKE
jgi:hypothetical protein